MYIYIVFCTSKRKFNGLFIATHFFQNHWHDSKHNVSRKHPNTHYIYIYISAYVSVCVLHAYSMRQRITLSTFPLYDILHNRINCIYIYIYMNVHLT